MTAQAPSDFLGGVNDPLEIRIESEAFDADAVHVFRVEGREAISRCFRFTIDVALPEPDELDPVALLGVPASLVFRRGAEVVRSIFGIIAEVSDHLETEASHRSYRVVLVPRAERLSLVATQEVYLDASVPELIAQKLANVGLAGDDAPQRLLGTYGQRSIVVQYKETDLDFVSRLAEHLGIFYFFEHEGGRDAIVFGDYPGSFHDVPGAALVPFRPRGEGLDVFRIESTARMTPSAFFVQDFNYRAPQVDLVGSYEATWGQGGGVVEYGPHHKTPDEGQSLARARAEERRVADAFFTGESSTVQLSAGGTFTLEHHALLGDRKLLVVEIEHHAEQPILLGTGSGRRSYKNTFRAVDAGLPYRPPRRTPKPRIHGVVPGIVEPRPDTNVGTIADLDDQGRYTIRLLFDATPFGERQASSPRVRMLQLHAGPGYGVHFPLKAGVEVLLAFVDGDPDRPIIVGCAPNPLTPSPVVSDQALYHRMNTATGILIEMKDGY